MEGDHERATRVEATLVASRPVGVEGGTGGVAGVGWKTAHTAYQSVAEERVAVPCWPPAALDVMSSSNEDSFAVCARGVYGTPTLLPGIIPPGAGEATTAAYTSSPAPTAAVEPVSTVVPSGARAATIWSSEPASATPEYSATAPWKKALAEAETVIVIPPGAAWLFSR